MVKTILSIFESRWSVRVTRDHPVHPWMFEWPADLLTRYAHVGDLGKTAVQLIRGSRVKQKHCTIRQEDLVQTVETIWPTSRKHGRHVLGLHFFWACDCDQMNFLSEQPEELSRRAHCEGELRKNNGTMNSPGQSKENHHNLFLGSTATTFLQQSLIEQEYTWKKIRQMIGLGQLDEGVDPPEARDSFDTTRQTCHPGTFRYDEKNVRHERFGQEVWSNIWMSRMCHDWRSSPSQVTRTHAGTGCAQNWRRVKKEEKHLWMQGNRSNPLLQATNVLCQRNGIAHQKNSGEWVKRM